MVLPNPSRVRVDPALLETGDLVERSRRGDRVARETLFLRFREPLSRFLHLRLPAPARGLLDTEDVVQEVCAIALASLDRFEYRGIGSFWAYLRRVGRNRVAKAWRRSVLAPAAVSGPLRDPMATASSPLCALVGKEELEAFEEALGRVPARSREALLLRFELGLGFESIAAECGFPSADAVRMAIGRAMERVARELNRGGHRN